MRISNRRLFAGLVAPLLGLTMAGPALAVPAPAGLVAGTPPATVAAAPAGVAARPGGHTVSYDHYSVSVDGRRVYLWSAEFHYWRLPSPDLWRDILQKLKAAGFNATSIYFDWAYHSPSPGVYDFTGVRDVERLLDIAAQVGIWVIARPGPYINAETDAGGFPGWLITQQGRARSSAPDYTAAYREWLSHIDPIIARHQVTDGRGSVLLYQAENEYGFNGDATYMAQLQQKIRADGITVPITHNYCCGDYTWATGPGSVQLPGRDSYPQGFDCSNPTVWRPVDTLTRLRADVPVFTPEYQGGAFDPWGGPGYEACRRLTGPDFERVFYKNNIANGATIQNFYMTYGGTSWGWLPDPQQVYTSYDYGAAVSEPRLLTGKYDELKRQGYFVTSVRPLARTDPAGTAPVTNADVLATARANPVDHTHFYILRHRDSTSTAVTDTRLTVNLGAGGNYPSVPQQAGTAIRLTGRDSKTLVAGYRMGSQRLQYSTSEILTHARIGNRDVAVLYGRPGEAGETVLRYAAAPRVRVLSGTVRQIWDRTRHDLRLDYIHQGLARVLVTPAHGTALLLLLGTDQVAGQFWREDTAAGPALVRGPELVRTASGRFGVLALTGDTTAATRVETWAAPAASRLLLWNGVPVRTRHTASDSRIGTVPGPRPVTLPALSGWRYTPATPEANPAYDDSRWQRANRTTTNNPTPPRTLPVLYADDYGFHHGDVWYRGHFTAVGTETGVDLSAITGRAGVWSVWLNGVFLGSTGGIRHLFGVPAGALRRGVDNVVSVLVENMGHNEDFRADDTHKEPRGLTGASLVGSAALLAWRIQGTPGGERPMDRVRGPFNLGGQYGERAGYYLPGYPDRSWRRVALPYRDDTPGTSWYRTTVTLHLPKGQDVPLGIRITDDPVRHYRALIYVNGWLMGRYVNDVGPQHTFPVHPGILRTDGRNTIAIAVWDTDAAGGGLGRVSLEQYGNVRTSLRVRDVPSPGYPLPTS
jgi:beta-galactosidase GanA